MNWWKSIGPVVVSAWKFGAMEPRRKAVRDSVIVGGSRKEMEDSEKSILRNVVVNEKISDGLERLRMLFKL